MAGSAKVLQLPVHNYLTRGGQILDIKRTEEYGKNQFDGKPICKLAVMHGAIALAPAAEVPTP